MRFIVAADHPCLAGHFPGDPIVPGVLILDHVLAAIEAMRSAPGTDKRQGPLGPLRLPQVKFVQPLRPGQAAEIQLDAIAGSDATAGGARWRFRVLHGDSLIASGDIVAA